jgi:putative membrane protein
VTLLVVLPVVAVLLLRDDGGGDGDPGMDRLRGRYAAGDLDDEEFERRRERLQES